MQLPQNLSQKKVIAFDLDGTLAASKSAITSQMSELLGKLLDRYLVCVISGGKYEQFQSQLISNLDVSDEELHKLHLMPTCGTRYFRFAHGEWEQVYAEELDSEGRKRIAQVLTEGAKELGLWEEKTWGDIIEDRGTQITFSALGQEAPVDAKHAWDADGAKKAALRDYVAPRLPEFEVRTGGTTSVDITKKGIDKAYGMQKLQETLSVTKDEILFIGDALQEGGNDYPVKAAGIDSIAVKNEKDTAKLIAEIISA